MKSMLTAFAAMAALALPAGLPTLVAAQEQEQEQQADPSPPRNDPGARYQSDESSPAPSVSNWVSERPAERPADQDRGRGGRDDGGNDGGDQDRGGEDRGGDGGGWNRGDDDGGNGGGWTRPDQPNPPPEDTLLPPPPPTQDYGGGGWNPDGDDDGNDGLDRDRGGNDGQDWNRGNDARVSQGGWNDGAQESAPAVDDGNGPQRVAPRGSFADSCSGSYVNQGRLYADCRDTRGNVRGTSIELARCSSSDIGNDNGLLVCHNVRGDQEGRGRNNGGGWGNGGGWDNGGWDRDRNNGGRNWYGDRYGRRDYGGFQNRWNQNDWRRDWNRGRSNDWWRNDRSFRGYSGYRFGYYFAPNYGYYSVPRNYWGQRWNRGDYLPSTFWRYSLNDYRTYGLGYPPPGTQWVAVDTTIYLIDRYDGYILEVIRDAWRW